jgi:hypothetical protein
VSLRRAATLALAVPAIAAPSAAATPVRVVASRYQQPLFGMGVATVGDALWFGWTSGVRTSRDEYQVRLRSARADGRLGPTLHLTPVGEGDLAAVAGTTVAWEQWPRFEDPTTRWGAPFRTAHATPGAAFGPAQPLPGPGGHHALVGLDRDRAGRAVVSWSARGSHVIRSTQIADGSFGAPGWLFSVRDPLPDHLATALGPRGEPVLVAATRRGIRVLVRRAGHVTAATVSRDKAEAVVVKALVQPGGAIDVVWRQHSELRWRRVDMR